MALGRFHISHLWSLLKETYIEWNEDEPFRLSAVVAYYAILSLPALLVIIIAVAGTIFGPDAIKGEIAGQVSDIVGSEAAKQTETMIAEASMSERTVTATIIGIGTLIFGATGVFFHLQKSLNEIWGVKSQPKRAFLGLLRDRAFSFGMVMVIAFLLLISLIVSAALSALSNWIVSQLPGWTIYFFRFIDLIISLGIITILFALIFKVLPDVKIKWRDVWTGAVVTSVLFVAGKFALGLYFSEADPGSAYGAAGSVIVILIWISYACLILFFGAEFTQVYARRYGDRIEPADYAVRTADYFTNRRDRILDREAKRKNKIQEIRLRKKKDQ
ncbi:MAG: YihY/virulence factor BrkB family protein [Bacteroidia bacterium]